MKGFKRIISIVVAVMLVCAQIPLGVLASGSSDSRWSTTNLVEGQADITLNDYTWDWLSADLKAGASYKYNFNIVATETAGYRLTTVAVRDYSAASDGTDGLYVVFNGADDQIRIGYEYTTNSSLIAVASGLGLTAAGTYEVEIISTPDAIEVYLNGSVVPFYDFSTGQYNTTSIAVSGLKDGKAGFNAQGNVLDAKVTDIAIYGEAEESGGSRWSTTNLVEGQADITLNDYTWDWLSADLKAGASYKYNFNIVATETAGYRLTTVAVRDYSAASDGTDGLYVVFNGADDQIRIGYEYTTNSSLIAVASGLGLTAAGTYEVEIISTPDAIEVYLNGSVVPFYDFSTGQYNTTSIAVSGLKDGKAGFNAQGNVLDAKITDIAIYGESDPHIVEPPIDTEAVENVINLINAIGTVTKESGSAIAAARTAYNALNDDEKALITNIDVLLEAETVYNQLNASQDIMLYSLSATDAMGFNHWPASVKIADVTGGGIAFTWKNAGTNMRQGINRGVKLDGLHAVFSGYEATSGTKQIAVYFADIDPQESYTQLNEQNGYQPLALIINTADGTLGIAALGDGYPITVIASSDALKYDALAGKEWSLFMDDNGNGSFTVTVNGVSGVITADMLSSCNKLTQYEDVYLTVCPWDWNGITNASLNLISLHDGDSACANDLTAEEMNDVLELIEKIKAIGIVTAESIDAIEACEADYAALNDIQKGCVINYNVLLAARYRYDQLTKETDEPCMKYYAIGTEDLAGTNHWANMLFYNDIADGGVRFEWKNGGTNFRRLINREVTLDGLHIVYKYCSLLCRPL